MTDDELEIIEIDKLYELISGYTKKENISNRVMITLFSCELIKGALQGGLKKIHFMKNMSEYWDYVIKERRKHEISGKLDKNRGRGNSHGNEAQ